MRTVGISALKYLVFVACLLASRLTYAEGDREKGALKFSEKVVAGGPGDFLEVRHMVLRGSQFDIGRKLAEIAKERHGVGAEKSDDKLRTRAQREYFQRNYPIHYQRMRGAAAAFDLKLEDDAHNVSTLIYGISAPGCSVVYYPPAMTDSGHGVLSRNYDFTTGTIAGLIPLSKSQQPCTSRPYIIETYPDEGYASIAVVAYDLLGSVLDGLNSEGLSVALLADDELQDLKKADPAPGTQAGLEVVQVLRMLLDTCKNVEEAKVALASSKLYYGIIPCHYVVADANGKAFVWENAPSMHYAHVWDSGDGPLITTNFMHYLHPEARDATKAGEPFATCDRYQTLREKTAAGKKFSLDNIKANNVAVMMTRPAPPKPIAATRTLWHSVYIPEQRRMEIDFYLGDKPGDDPKAPPQIRRSGYLGFQLDADKQAGR